MTESGWGFDPPNDKPNPFQVLQLSADATNAEIVERGKDLNDGAVTKEEAQLYRWAMEQLITHPMTRLAYELLEMPGAQYGDDDWERFAKLNKKAPIDLAAMARASATPGLADFNLAALIELLLDGLLKIEPADVRVAVEHAPFVPSGGLPPVEVRDVIFG
jgi:hypothetical protein